MIREQFRRFYSSVATDYTESAIGRKRSERERLSRDVAEYLARGGRISQLPYGAVAIEDTYGGTAFETHIAPPVLPGSAPHDPAKVAVRAKRRRYGRLPNA